MRIRVGTAALQLVVVAALLLRLGTVSLPLVRGMAAVVSAVAPAAVAAVGLVVAAARMAAAAVVARPLLAEVRAEHSHNGSQTHFFAIWTEQVDAQAGLRPAPAEAVAVEMPAIYLKMAATVAVVAGSTT